MGVAIGILLIAATIASLVAVHVRANKMLAQRGDDSWLIDPDSGHHGGGHFDGFSGGDAGGNPHG
jgi:hypothetical protein